jgi:hypothetical protein
MEENNLALISPDDLSFVENNSMNEKQLAQILKKTPSQYVKKRPAKGGGQWEYVTGGYIKKCLNLLFGWDWDFEIVDEKIMEGEAIVKGKLTCRSNGKVIVKMQFGNKDVIYRKQTDTNATKIALSIGNDLKAAATDCLKKCAAEIGIAADIYNKEDFREVKVDTSEIQIEDLTELFDAKKEALTEKETKDAYRIIENREENSYRKLFKLLKSK